MWADIVVLLCWVIFLVYWATSWRAVKPTKETRVNFHGRWRLGVLGIIVIFLVLRYFGAPLPHCQPDIAGCHFHLVNGAGIQSILWQVAAILLIVSGLTVAVIARKTIGDNWSSNVDLKERHQLVTTGIYGYIRHPIYTGVMLMLLANLIISTSSAIILVNILVACFFIFKLVEEEKLLTEHFSKEYPEYKKRTKALIPFVI